MRPYCSSPKQRANRVRASETRAPPLKKRGIFASLRPSHRLYGVNIHDASNNLIGGTTPGAGNTIGFCAGPGVYVDSGTGNNILGNSIYGNGGILNLGGVGQGVV